jgi:hypothetical protein
MQCDKFPHISSLALSINLTETGRRRILRLDDIVAAVSSTMLQISADTQIQMLSCFSSMYPQNLLIQQLYQKPFANINIIFRMFLYNFRRKHLYVE